MSTKIRDIQAPTGVTDAAARRVLDDIRQAWQQREPSALAVGDVLDKFVTRRELREAGAQWSGGRFTGIGGGGGGVGPVGPPGPPGSGVVPDLTPPPTPTGLVLTAGLSYLFITHDAPLYTEGHGHDRTIVYGAKWPSGSPPTFASAVPLMEFQGTVAAYPTDLGTRWCIWIKWKSIDGVESASPAGGTNGAQATTGVVGTSDLGSAIVLAGNLAPGSVTADKAAFEIGGDNLLANNSFEVDANANGMADGWAFQGSTQTPVASRTPGRISGFAQRVTWTGANSTFKGFRCDNSIGGGVRGGWLASNTYVVSFYARADSAKASGCQLVWGTAPASSVTLKNPNLATTWQRYAFRVAMGGSVDANGALAFSCINAAALTGWIEFDDVQVEEGDYLTSFTGKLALNTIVAGDGAIANLAILNANIANGAVDDLKVANVSAAKLTVGDGTVGGDLKSAVFNAGTAGWRIRPDGTFEANNAILRGTIVATAGAIGGNTITASEVRSAGYVSGSSGWRLPSTGLLEAYASGGTRRLNLGASGTTPVLQIGSALSILGNGTASFGGILNAAGGVFTGALSGTSGTFSGTLTAAAIDAVDTINLAPQSVTILASAYTAAESVTAGNVAMQSVTFTSTGSPVSLVAGFVHRETSGTAGAGNIELQRTQGGVTTLLALRATVEADGEGPVLLPPVTDTPAAGSVTYTLRKTSSGTNYGVSKRGLTALEVKR